MKPSTILIQLLRWAMVLDRRSEFLVLRLDTSGAVEIGITGNDPQIFEGVLEELGHYAARGEIRPEALAPGVGSDAIAGQSIIIN